MSSPDMPESSADAARPDVPSPVPSENENHNNTTAPPATVPTTAPKPATVKQPQSTPATTTATSRRPSTVGSAAGGAGVTMRTTTSKSKKKKGAAVTMATAPASGGGGGGGGGGEKGAQGENTGRWTAEEHRLFLQGLEQHGKGWKKIASLIKSRTVVQIRTHAQKYFQKLAKARQNGEEGDVTMEGRGGVSSVASVTTAVAAQTTKRRRQTTGTKRKAIQSVVASAQRQGKKMAAAAAAAVPTVSNKPTINPAPPLPAVAPTLAYFVLPNAAGAAAAANKNAAAGGPNAKNCVPSISTSQGTISGPALEDSIFRFLTPAPVAPSEPQVNDVARQAGANPITLPTENPSAAPTISGEPSPTTIADLSIYPSWTDAKDPPSWYAKGADVDALLDVADTLDWLTDTGDIHETYQPPVEAEPPTSIEEHDEADAAAVAAAVNDQASTGGGDLGEPGAVNNASVTTLPEVDPSVDTVVPPLPSLFDGAPDADDTVSVTDEKSKHPELPMSTSDDHLKVESPTEHVVMDDDHLQVFETEVEENDFMATILESTTESSASLPLLG